MTHLRFLVMRPQPEAAQTARSLRADGHSVLTAPLLRITYYGGPVPDLANVRALLLSSVNGARALLTLDGGSHGLAPEILRDLPCFAVGSVSAQAARNVGLKQVYIADGNGASLGKLVAQHWSELTKPPINTQAQATALHITGRESAKSLALSLASASIPTRHHVLYAANAAPYLPTRAARALQAGIVNTICLHSPRTGRIFLNLLNTAGLNGCLRQLTVLCLSHAVAQAIKDAPWRAIRVTEHSNDTSLRYLALSASSQT